MSRPAGNDQRVGYRELTDVEILANVLREPCLHCGARPGEQYITGRGRPARAPYRKRLRLGRYRAIAPPDVGRAS